MKRPGLFLFAMACLGASAQAQIDGPQFEATLLAGMGRLESNLEMKSDALLGMRLGFYPSPQIGVEASVDRLATERRHPTQTERSLGLFALRAVRRVHAVSSVSPYAALGIGVTRLNWESAAWNSLSGVAALGVNFNVLRSTALRVESQFFVGSFGGDLRQNLGLQVGLSWGFGQDSDQDRDGISDTRDRCPNTPARALIDANGCPYDADADGIYDGLDLCPDTELGSVVDAVGCPLSKPEQKRR